MSKIQLFLFAAIFVAATSAFNHQYPSGIGIGSFNPYLRQLTPIQEFVSVMNVTLTKIKNLNNISFSRQLFDTTLKTNVTKVTESLNGTVTSFDQLLALTKDYGDIINNDIEAILDMDHTLYKLNELVYILLGVNITECHEESIMNIVKETISFRDNVGECFYKSMPDAVAYGVENGPIIRIGMEFIIKFNEIAQKAAQCDNADSKVSALCTNDAVKEANRIAGAYIETLSAIKKQIDFKVAFTESSRHDCVRGNKLPTLREEIEKILPEVRQCALNKLQNRLASSLRMIRGIF